MRAADNHKAATGQYLTFAMPSQIDNNPAIPIADEL
jgi:hypothetical protein